MGRSKNQSKARAAKQQKKAKERKERLRTRQVAPPPRPMDDGLARAAALLSGLAARGYGMDMDQPLDWANTTSYTHAAAKAVLDGRLALDAPQPPHHLAKLEAWLGTPRPWGLQEARERSVAELVAQLARYGVQVEEAGFRERAAGFRSAWRLGQSLVPDVGDAPHGPGAIATELWRRWLPDVPCYERACDRMQGGYLLLGSRGSGPLSLWMDAWRDLVLLLPEDLSSLRAATLEAGTLDEVGNWAGYLLDEVMNRTHDDPATVPEALEVVRWLQRFDDPPTTALVADEADLLAHAGQLDEGIQLLEAARDRDPFHAMPYARLADLLAYPPAGYTPDPGRATRLLRDALALPVRDADGWDIEKRLRDLEQRTATRE